MSEIRIQNIGWVPQSIKKFFIDHKIKLASGGSRSLIIQSEEDGNLVATLTNSTGSPEIEVHSHPIFSKADVSKFRSTLAEDIDILIEVAKTLMPEAIPKKKFNHAFELAFSLDTDNPGDEVTKEELLKALKRRVQELETTGEIIEAVGLPYDTYEN